MIELKTPDEIDAMRAAGIVVADALSAVKAEARAGVSLAALDQVARDVLADAGASSPFLGYRPGFARAPFPGVICTSVNDAVLRSSRGSWAGGTTNTVSTGTAGRCAAATAHAAHTSSTRSRSPPTARASSPRS